MYIKRDKGARDLGQIWDACGMASVTVITFTLYPAWLCISVDGQKGLHVSVCGCGENLLAKW